MDIKSKIKELAAANFEKIKSFREHLHANPELSFVEYKTAEYISKALKEAKLSHQTGIAGTGIAGVINAKKTDAKTILLRADIDALPIQEKNDVPYRSKNEGVMHACGHDVHSACLFGALLIIKELQDFLPFNVKFIFQPGEEVLPGGASLMIKEGVLKNPDVDFAIAQHVFPDLESGKIGFKSGMYMASTDEIYISVKGKGGHAAMPNAYINPLLIASELLIQLNHEFMINKTFQKNEPDFENIPTVLAFGKIEGKGATNVIPDCVTLSGTFRTMNEKWRSFAHEKIKSIASEIAQKWGGEIIVNSVKGYPFLVNDSSLTQQLKSAAVEFLGKDQVIDLPLRMTAEDFAYITQQVPSCFYRLGTGNLSKNCNSGVHTPTFDIDETALETGSALMAWWIFNLHVD